MVETEAGRLVKRLIWATTLLYVFMAGFAVAGVFFYLHQRAQDHAQIAQVTRALCSVRQSYERQLAAAEDFLRTHPQGTSDFSPALIRKSIADIKPRITALADVKCP